MQVNPVLIAGARPRGPHGGAGAGSRGRARRGPRSRVRRRRHRADRDVSRLSLRHRRSSLLHQGRRGRAAVARAARRRDDPRAPPVAHLLPGPLLRLPAAAAQRRAQPRAGGKRAHDVELPARAPAAGRSRGDARGLGGQPLRPALCTRRSSRPTPRRSGACPATRSAPTGRPSASGACRSAAPSRTRSFAAARRPRWSASSSTRGWGPGRCGSAPPK